jgi:hypothetical protein
MTKRDTFDQCFEAPAFGARVRYAGDDPLGDYYPERTWEQIIADEAEYRQAGPYMGEW